MANRTDIPMSAGLAEILGRCEQLRQIAEAATDEDAPTRATAMRPCGSQTVDAAELEFWEEKMSIRFPRDLLALEAIGIPTLHARISVPLAPLTLEKTYRQKLALTDGWVIVGAARGAGSRESVALSTAGTDDADPSLLIVTPGGNTETRLCALLEQRLQSVDGWPETTGVKVTTADIAPAIIAWGSSAAVGRRVKHKKFGAGTVKKEIAGATDDDVKLEIDFDDVGVKVLIARFVTDVSGGSGSDEIDGVVGPRLADGPFRELAKTAASRLDMSIAPDFIKALSAVPLAVFAEKLYWKIEHPGLWLEAGDGIGSAGWLEDLSARTDSVRDGRYRGPPGIAIGRAAGGEILCLVAKNKRGGGPLERLAQIDHETLELEPVGGTFGSAEDLWNVLRESGILVGD